jgi:hypothetical protein
MALKLENIYDGYMLDPIDPEFCVLVLEAVDAIKRVVHDSEPKVGYFSRRDLPSFEVNDQGWPSISKSPIGALADGPMNWDLLFTYKKGTGPAKFDSTDVPELERVVQHVLQDSNLRSKIDGFGVPIDDGEVSRALSAQDAIRVVTTVAERSEATGEDNLRVYIQHERAFLSPSLTADVVVPIALVQLEISEPLHLGNNVWIEVLDEPLQRARAVEISNSINPFLVSAATHARRAAGPYLRQLSGITRSADPT